MPDSEADARNSSAVESATTNAERRLESSVVHLIAALTQAARSQGRPRPRKPASAKSSSRSLSITCWALVA
jgi:hypothetical protein